MPRLGARTRFGIPEEDGNVRTYGSLDELYFGPSIKAEKVLETEKGIRMTLRSTSTSAICTCCGQVSTRSAGTVKTYPKLDPARGEPTTGVLISKRYWCDNIFCVKHTFTEERDTIAHFRHFTDTSYEIAFVLGLFCSAKTASLILHFMGIEMSHDTVRILFSRAVITDDPDVEFIGVDDMCRKKGDDYNTHIYSGVDHRLMAILPGRDGKALIEWLKKHPKVRIACRDRASAYAAALSKILPQCLQIADRYHFVANLIQHIADIFNVQFPDNIYIKDGVILSKEPAKVETPLVSLSSPDLEKVSIDNSAPVGADGKEISVSYEVPTYRSEEEERMAEDKRKEKYVKVTSVRTDWSNSYYEGISDHEVMLLRKELSAKYYISLPMVDKFVAMTDAEALAVLKPVKRGPSGRPRVMDGYVNMAYKAFAAGHEPAFVFSYLLHRGFPGSYSTLANHLASIGRTCFGLKLSRWSFYDLKLPQDVARIPRRDIVKYITIKDRSRMDGKEVSKNFDLIKKRYPIVETAEKAYLRFHAMVEKRDASDLDAFLKDYEFSMISPFVEGVKRDYDAVKLGIESGLSSGFVEGMNSEEENNKRIRGGKSGVEHLFRVCYCKSAVKQSGIPISKLFPSFHVTQRRQ